MSAKLGEYEDKCKAIMSWADDRGEDQDFDTTFVESIQEQLEEGRDLSPKQMDAIDHILDQFRIEV